MSCDRKVIVLVSDGNIRPALPSYSQAEMVKKANIFKTSGGIIICVGIRANGDGYLLLRTLATPGFFMNVFGDGMAPINDTIAKLGGLAGYYCAGTSPTGTVTYGAELPDPSPLTETEFTGSGTTPAEEEDTSSEHNLHGDGPPDESLGVAGDTYVDDLSGGLYWKSATGWKP